MPADSIALEPAGGRSPGGVPVLLQGGAVLDVVTGEWRSDSDVLVDGDTIVAVAPGVEPDVTPEIIVCRGLYLLPGLIDSHVHLTASTGDLASLTGWPASYAALSTARTMHHMLRRGFTTVRDINGADHGIARAERAGLISGPRVFFGGKGLSPTGGHSDVRGPQTYANDGGPDRPGLGRVADGVDEVRLAARDELRKGADHIKVMASGGVASPTDRLDSLQYSLAELRAVVEEVGNANRYVAAHAYSAEAIIRALDCGVRSIEHGNFLDAKGAAYLRRANAVLVPTMVTYWWLMKDGRDNGLSDAQVKKANGVFEAGLEAISLAAEMGAAVAFGTDLLGAMHSHQCEEFEIRSRVQTNIEVIRSATVVGAALLGASMELGRIDPGFRADIVAFKDDPLERIGVLASGKPDLVMQDGAIVR